MLHSKYNSLVKDNKNIRNFGIIAHVDHGKTTMSDCFIAGSRIIAEEAAGDKRLLDFRPDEQERGITIVASNITLIYDDRLVLNLTDTPGHADFGAYVTQAMRTIDGAILVVDCVEGIKAQTETVLKQAMEEKVALVLFINKVDRLMTELKYTYEQVEEHLRNVIMSLNKLIVQLSGSEDINKFNSSVIVMGSALYKWAIGPYSRANNLMNLKDIYKYYTELPVGTSKETIRRNLQKKAPLYENLMYLVEKYLPPPDTAQLYKIDNIWTGEKNTIYDNMVTCNKDSSVVGIVTNVSTHKDKGELLIVRLYSGTVTKNTELFFTNVDKPMKVLKVNVFVGRDVEEIDKIYAGNIGIIQGISGIQCGAVVYNCKEVPSIKKLVHRAEPVVTVSITPKKVTQLSKLKDIIKRITNENITLKSSFSEETGEHLLSGVGKLQLEVVVNSIKRDDKLDVEVTPPEIIYRESCVGNSDIVDGSSSNKHNKFKISVFRIPVETETFLENNTYKLNSIEFRQGLEESGISPELARKVIAVNHKNIMFNVTKGVQYLDDTKPNIIAGFVRATKFGPSIRKPVVAVGVLLQDCVLHCDFVHRSPSQIVPIINKLIHTGMENAGIKLLQPVSKLYLTTPIQHEGNCKKEILRRRGNIIQIDYSGSYLILDGSIPVKELDGFAEALMSITGGKINWYLKDTEFVEVPERIKQNIIFQKNKK